MSGWRHETLGSRINREAPVTFQFDGNRIHGFEGDTIASALLAAGISIVGRSFKYHRPRGLWGMGAEEPNAIVDVRLGEQHMPNQRATTVLIKPGMDVRSVNASPSATRDRFSFMDRFNRFLPAGFYYKTFMAFKWIWYEPFIRRMAGLGKVAASYAPSGDVPHVSASCEMLIVGGGPSGLSAARAAVASGKKVWVIDDGPDLGGSLRWRGGSINGEPWQSFMETVKSAIEQSGGRVISNATVWGVFDHNMFGVWLRKPDGPDQGMKLRAKDVVIAAGAIERPLWFANNDLPGVMSLEAGFYYLQCFGVVPGKRIVIATANDASYASARAFEEAGVDVTLLDARPQGPDQDGVRTFKGVSILSAEGRTRVRNIVTGSGAFECDAVLCSGGFTPSVHLWCQAGGKLDWDEARDALIPHAGTCAFHVVGAAAGEFGLGAALNSGQQAFGVTSSNKALETDEAYSLTQAPVRPNPDLPGRQWIDLQNDVTLKDVGLAAREGFTSVEHLKRYTTLGMANDQGRTSNFAGLAAMAASTGRTIPETGTTTYRPPFEPLPFPVIAGRRRGELFNPPKRLRLEREHRLNEARFREYGGWLRPSVYGQGNEGELAQAEAKAARETAAIFDASPLGKLEVLGPDAGRLLDFASYVQMSTLKPGRARYGFMLSESGVVYDDGVVLRLNENRFIFSASSSHVEGVRFRLEDARQDRLGRKNVCIHDVTQGLVTLTVTGPRSKEVLEKAGIDCGDLSHMGVRETELDGHFLRIARISFTGDRSYELSVPARAGQHLHSRLGSALAALGGRWIGLEAVMILRAEKGYILIGKDTDGNTMPHDLGWGGPREKREDEYLGKRSLFTPKANAEDRRQLVGLDVAEGMSPLVTGSHLVPAKGPQRSLGFVTSSYFSPALGRPVALAMLENGAARVGEQVEAFNDGELTPVTVSPACAFDPEGERLNG